jgi:ATP-dependent Lon protease
MASNTTTIHSIPVLPLKNATLFPGTILPLRVMREKSMQAIEFAIKNKNLVLTLSENDPEGEDTVENEKTQLSRLAPIGTLARIEKVTGNADDGYQLYLRGVSRYRVEHLHDNGTFYLGDGVELKDLDDVEEATKAALLINVKETTRAILNLVPGNTEDIQERVESIEDLALLTHVCLAHMDLTFGQRQEFLETVSVKQRSLNLLSHLAGRKNQLQVKHEVNGRLNERLGKQQREAILREQMRTIQDELGETSQKGKDYRKKIEDAGMPEDVKKIAMDELDRMESLGAQSPEVGVIRNYLDLLVALPWTTDAAFNAESIDLAKAKEVLKKDHEGLEEVKKKILQSLAIAKLKKTIRGQIMLLVGPPGVGKTSLGQSIARAMNRKFTRVALGGVRDEADIRGHRRTYIGAMPGRIIQAIKRVGAKDAVILLDEIDKVGRGSHGDPTAALLELLDPEQNSTFTDHYLDVPYDLSEIVFIATANSLENIPGPLLDRMDIIEVSGYSTPEKIHIAHNHLIPKIREDLGLSEAQVTLEDEALLKTIHSYTREAGVRDLNRKLSGLFRAVTERVVAAQESFPIHIDTSSVEELLGKERFQHEVVEIVSVPGVATGLAWTPMGGEILFIESSLMPGNGKLMLTGQLGEVMKESTQIALSLLRSNLAHIVPSAEFEKRDVHVHVPAGAVPKDGPSAGVTMLASLASVFLKQSIDPKLGMSGEITLRGAVLPVGGIKEKIIAAHRAGLKKIILSKRNERDLKDVPEEVRNDLQFVFVEKVTELLQEIFELPLLQAPRRDSEIAHRPQM